MSDEVEHRLDGEELLAKALKATGIRDVQLLCVCTMALQQARGEVILGDQNALQWAIENAKDVRETYEHMKELIRVDSVLGAHNA